MGLTVAIQTIDRGWITLGTQQDGGLGVVAESITLDGMLSEYGCLNATFRIRQNPKWMSLHLQPFTPIVFRNGDTDVWSGRIIATPTTYGEQDVEVMIECQGWGQHLKDDCTDREWVVRDMSRFVDGRQHLNADLGFYNLNSQVTIDTNNITFSIGQGQAIVTSKSLGEAVLDLGPNNGVKRIVITYTTSNNWGASCYLYARTNSVGTWTTGTDPTSTFPVTPIGAGGTYAATFTTGQRYLIIFPYWVGATATAGGDCWIKISDVQVYTDTADESGNASALKASTVISEALDACAPLINSDRSKIATTSTNLPNFPGSPGYRYTNELIDQANSIHGYIARLSPESLPVFGFQPQPTDYTWAVGASQYTLLEPAANDGRGVANRVISEFEDAAGVASYGLAGGILETAHYSQLANPTFDLNTTGWSATAGSILRDTSPAYAGAGSLRLTSNGSGTSNATTGYEIPVAPSRVYRLSFAFYRRVTCTVDSIRPISNGGTALTQVVDAAEIAAVIAAMAAQAVNTWAVYSFEFRTNGDTSNIGMLFQFVGAPPSTAVCNIDSVYVMDERGTLVGRRGFQRTLLRPMGARSTEAIADAIAALELSSARFPPFRGTIGITGRVRKKGGGEVDVCELVSRVGDAILIEDLYDPYTQALGRQGVIQATSYNESTNTIELQIDTPSNFILQLRNRLSMGVR